MMKIFRDLAEVEIPGRACVCLGAFDGVHLGHQALLRQVVNLSRSRGLVSVALTFEPHPEALLSPAGKPPLLTTTEEKLPLFSELGVAVAVVAKFDRKLANLSAESFVKKVLLEKLNAQSIVLGPGSTFGKGGQGDAALLHSLGDKMGFGVAVAEGVEVEGEAVSSTAIRKAILAGEVDKAAAMLGRPYRLAGSVVAGAGRGHLLGFPTANIKPPAGKALPPDGVYACISSLEETPTLYPKPGLDLGEEHVAVVYIGKRPTFDAGERLIEAHICEETLELYGHDLSLYLIGRLRGDKKFDKPEDLAQQMAEDARQAFELVGEYLAEAVEATEE